MTLVTEGSGTRWVEVKARKRRKSPRAVRFADIKVGDQVRKAWSIPSVYMAHDRRVETFYIVTDLWFDPVRGQENYDAGRMAAISKINSDGTISPRKDAYPLRGLASQQFQYAGIDYLELTRIRKAAHDKGEVVGIGHGQVIRARPKVPGHSL